jgi:hypothetical protein
MFFVPGIAVAVATFPGVVVHEVAHLAVCRILGIPVYEVCYFRFGTPTGYVVHQKINDFWRLLLVGCGPFLINSVLGAILAFPSALRVFEFEGAASSMDGILVWLGVSVAMHAFPSAGDARAMWEAVTGKDVPVLAKLIGVPLVGLMFLLVLGSGFFFDLVYGILIALAFPKMIVDLLA